MHLTIHDKYGLQNNCILQVSSAMVVAQKKKSLLEFEITFKGTPLTSISTYNITYKKEC